MALQSVGPISLSDIKAEYGLPSPVAFSDLRGIAAGVPTTGALSISDLLGTSNVIVKTVAAAVNNLNVSTLFTAAEWTSATPKRVNINAGVVIGSTVAGSAALLTGTGRGGTLQISNSGTIYGIGGAANSGAGGPAINCQQTGVTITNNAGGVIRGGGGGGGKGGTGGTGGQGSYPITVYEPSSGYNYNVSTYYWNVRTSSQGANLGVTVVWNGTIISGASGTTYTSGIYTYEKGPTLQASSATDNKYNIRRSYASTAYTTGGAGGAGGAGGMGQGFGNTDGGNVGVAGTAGSAGGTNAGAGGKGGTGGTGGAWATAGATGSTGSTGAAGNYTAGSAGTAGTAGGAAGAAITGSARTVVNNGTISGAT